MKQAAPISLPQQVVPAQAAPVSFPQPAVAATMQSNQATNTAVAANEIVEPVVVAPQVAPQVPDVDLWRQFMEEEISIKSASNVPSFHKPPPPVVEVKERTVHIDHSLAGAPHVPVLPKVSKNGKVSKDTKGKVCAKPKAKTKPLADITNTVHVEPTVEPTEVEEGKFM